MDALKMKHDLSELVHQAPNFVTSEGIERLTSDVKQFRTSIANINFEIQSARDLITKEEKSNETNLKDITTRFANIKVSLENIDQQGQGNGKKLVALDDKLRSYMKNAALTSGGGHGAGNIVEEIEEAIAKIRDDQNDLKKDTSSELVMIRNDLNRKFTKEDGTELEKRMSSYIESVVIQIKSSFVEKEILQKRLNKLDRNIRTLKNDLTSIKDKEPEFETGMFTKLKVQNTSKCASCEKDIKNLLTTGAEHQNWNKMPFHRPNDNIARYGAGFSKILQKMQPSESEAVLIE